MEVYKHITAILLNYIEDISTPYAIFEKIDTKHERFVKGFFIMCFGNKNKFLIGRSSQANLCEKNDKFISKIHC